MSRRAALAAAVAVSLTLVLAALLAVAAAADPGAEKAQVDNRLGGLREQAAQQDRQAGVLTDELSAVASQVRNLQAGVDAQQARLAVLESRVADARTRLATLERTIATQTARLTRLRGEYGIALRRLERRVRELYMTDGPDTLSFVLGTASFTDLIDNLDLLGRIGRQDERIAAGVKRARDGVADARRRTRSARDEAVRVEAAASAAASEQRGLVSRMVASRDALAAAEQEKRRTLASIRGDRAAVLAEIDDLEAQSEALAAQIRAAQERAAEQQASAASASPVVSGSGQLSWPVSGAVTSGFGVRWGRMHEGIDIAVGTGTPVHAAAAGTVIYAGWMEGYGNLVVIDHGNGLSTAYGHNSALASSVGQTVSAGQVIAYSGSTGHSTGPHVHFEVRVNGSPVDPLGYL
jgi:murein DD-endopeptidase MepM/ murein hydrolase activator NlpD